MAKAKKGIKSEDIEPEPPRSKGGRPRALDEEDQGWIRETLGRQPSLTISELTALFEKERGRAVGRSTLGDCLKAMGLSYKKRPRAAGSALVRPQPPHQFNARTRRTANSHSPSAYPSDLTDAEWAVLEPLLLPKTKRGRPRQHQRRRIVDALRYMSRTGCQWRYLPKDFPKWTIVAKTYYRWLALGLWDRVNAALREKIRIQEGREAQPSGGLIDSQAVKTNDKAEERGYDAGKKVKGRHRHILTDTLGLILAIVVHAASIQDRDGVRLLITPEVRQEYPELKKLWLDGGYAGKAEEWLKSLGYDVEITARNDGLGAWVAPDEEPAPRQEGFVLQKRRWVVERTFAWLTKYRRLSKDYEAKSSSSRNWILLAANALMLSRIAA
jgi:putative transposase